MTTDMLEFLSPPDIGEDKILLSVNPLVLPLLALNTVIIDIDYSQVPGVGVLLPIEVEVQPPLQDGTGYVRRKFTKQAPSSFSFIPLNAGQHLVRVKECCHNLWQGRLLIEVGGDESSTVATTERI